MRYTKLALAVPVLLGLSAAQAHAGLVITPTFDSSWSTDLNAAADQATINSLITNVYEKDFTNNVTVAIDFSDVNSGLGTTQGGTYGGFGYDDYRTKLTDVKSIANGGDGNNAFLSNLPAGANPVPGNSAATIEVTPAQGRLLGYSTPGFVTVPGETGLLFDANIQLNIGLTTPAGGYSLTGVAAHEINEVLGVNSALNGLPSNIANPVVMNVGAEDFYRYSAGVRSFTTDTNAQVAFSDDGGTTTLEYYNQQASGDRHDWASDGESYDFAPAVQDAFSTPNVTSNITFGPAEFAELNDIGYNRSNPTVAPEPSQLAGPAFMAFGMFGLILRARKRKTENNRA